MLHRRCSSSWQVCPPLPLFPKCHHPVKKLLNPCALRGSGRKMFSHHSEDKATLSAFHMDLCRTCVYIYCTSWRPGHTPPCCFALGTNMLLHPAPIKEHKELFDSLYKPKMTNNCIVYWVIPLLTLCSTPPLCQRLLCVMSAWQN